MNNGATDYDLELLKYWKDYNGSNELIKLNVNANWEARMLT